MNIYQILCLEVTCCVKKSPSSHTYSTFPDKNLSPPIIFFPGHSSAALKNNSPSPFFPTPRSSVKSLVQVGDKDPFGHEQGVEKGNYPEPEKNFEFPPLFILYQPGDL